MQEKHEEIERKWLIKKGKKFNEFIQKLKSNTFEIEQYYTLIDDDKEIRYRKIQLLNNKSSEPVFFMTVKVGKGKERIENEMYVDPLVYSVFKSHKKGLIITKTRYGIYYYPFNHSLHSNNTNNIELISMELDDYSIMSSSFSSNYAIIEKEFSSKEQSDLFQFVLSDNQIIESVWEVTQIPCFKNKNIALDGFTRIFEMIYNINNQINWIHFPQKKRGLFIVFEGIDGSGKSTIIEQFTKYPIIKDFSTGNNLNFIYTYEPTKKNYGKMFRETCLTNDKSDPVVDCMLLALDRHEHSKDIQQLLDNGINVISDRYVDSNIVYQYVFSNIRKNWIKTLNEDIVQPNLIFIFDVTPEEALNRIKKRNSEQNVKFERLDNLTKMRTEFLNISELYFKPDNIYRIISTTNKSIQDIYKEVFDNIIEYLNG